MNALDVYTKRNIQDYLARPEKNTIKFIQKRNKKLDSTFAKMIFLQNVVMKLLIGVIYYVEQNPFNNWQSIYNEGNHLIFEIHLKNIERMPFPDF